MRQSSLYESEKHQGWKARYNSTIDDVDLVADVFGCEGIHEAIVAGVKAIVDESRRVVFVKSDLGRHRSQVVGYSIVDCVNLLVDNEGRRTVNAQFFGAVAASSNEEIDSMLDIVCSWLDQPFELRPGGDYL